MGRLGLGVVIPARNEEAMLPLCLAALTREKLLHGHIREIVVADNGSTDATVGIAQRLGAGVVVVEGNISAVRNAGARLLDTEFLCFLDADIEIKPGWSQAIVNHVASTGDAALRQVFGRVVGVEPGFTWIEKAWHAYLEGNRKPRYVNSGNLAVARDWYWELGGFAEHLVTGEDVDLCRRSREAGGGVCQVEDMQVVHHGYPRGLGRFLLREFWHGLSALEHFRHGHAKRIDWLALAFLLSGPLLVGAGWRAPGVAAGLVAALVVALGMVGWRRTGRTSPWLFLQIGFLLTLCLSARACALPGALLRNRVRMGGGRRGTS